MSNKSISRLKVKNNWWEIFQGNTKRIFESRILPKYIKTCRWFGSKALNIKRINIVENILIGEDKSDARLLFLNVEYFKNIKEMYLLPITFSQSEERTDKTIAYLNTSSKKGRIFDAVNDKKFQNYLLLMIKNSLKIKGKNGIISAYSGKYLNKFNLVNLTLRDSRVLTAQQSNSSILYDKHLLFKLFRKLSEGMNPDFEITKYISENTNFSNVPPFAGYMEYKKGKSEIIIGMLQGFIPNQGDAWEYTVDSIGKYYKKILNRNGKLEKHFIEDFENAQEESSEILGKEKAKEMISNYSSEKEKRVKFTYEIGEIAMKNKAETSLNRAKKFNEEVRKILGK